MSVPASTRKWATKCASTFHIVLSSIVFLFLDCLETVLCLLFRYLDDYFEGKPSCCYCENTREVEDDEVSETLCGRSNVFREMGFLQFARKWDEGRSKKVGGLVTNRWSDCGCESCVSWMKNGDQKLYVVVNEPSHGILIYSSALFFSILFSRLCFREFWFAYVWLVCISWFLVFSF